MLKKKKAVKQFNSRDFSRISSEMIAIEKIFGGLWLTLYVRDYYKIGCNDMSET